jgi:hypothetical protein
MKNYTVFRSVTAALAAAKSKLSKSGSVLKLGLDIHRDKFVVAALRKLLKIVQYRLNAEARELGREPSEVEEQRA